MICPRLSLNFFFPFLRPFRSPRQENRFPLFSKCAWETRDGNVKNVHMRVTVGTKEWQGRGRAEKQGHKDVKGRKESADGTNKCKALRSSPLLALHLRKSVLRHPKWKNFDRSAIKEQRSFPSPSDPWRWICSPMTPTLIFPMTVLSNHQICFNLKPTLSLSQAVYHRPPSLRLNSSLPACLIIEH